VNANGVIRAGAIILAANDRILVQNTGGSATSDDRAGLFAGAGGITLVDTSPGTPIEVIINGRQQTANGTVTGKSLIAHRNPQAGEGSSAAARGSTAKVCPFDGSFCALATPPVPPPPPPPFVAEGEVTTSVADITDLVDPQNAKTNPPDVVLADLIQIERTV